jgi:hypothetical protein
MDHQKTVTVLGACIVTLAAIAALTGMLSSGGPGAYEYESIRGEIITIHGEGVYRHMSADLAPQGIAQDYVTFFIAIPLLIYGIIWARKGSLKGRFLLAGTLGYFLVSYLFYLVMGMYNILFLLYVSLTGVSFFAFALTLLSIEPKRLHEQFAEKTPVRVAGGFLIFNGVAIGLMWLGIVVPPLLDGTIIPIQTEHYTTLIVQGLDLAILLPLSVVTGILFIRKRPLGYLLAPVYFVFLSILMTALIAKIVAMGLQGQNVMPAVIIIPVITAVSIVCTWLIFRSISSPT